MNNKMTATPAILNIEKLIQGIPGLKNIKTPTAKPASEVKVDTKAELQMKVTPKSIDRVMDGKNVGKEVKRGYLNPEEFNVYFMLHAVVQVLNGTRSMSKFGVTMWDEWEQKKIITKEQKKNLKSAYTFLKKFSDSVAEDNLDVKSKEYLAKRNLKWDFRLVDDYMLLNLRKILDEAQEVHMPKDNFYDLVEASMEVNCKGCTKDRCDCEYHTFFQERLVPPYYTKGEVQGCNCEYSYGGDTNGEK